MTELEMCCGTCCDKRKLVEEFEVIKKQRDDLILVVNYMLEVEERPIVIRMAKRAKGGKP